MVLLKQQTNLSANQIVYGSIKQEIFTIALGKKWLDDNNILIDCNHNVDKSAISEMYIKNLKGKSMKNDSY